MSSCKSTRYNRLSGGAAAAAAPAATIANGNISSADNINGVRSTNCNYSYFLPLTSVLAFTVTVAKSNGISYPHGSKLYIALGKGVFLLMSNSFMVKVENIMQINTVLWGDDKLPPYEWNLLDCFVNSTRKLLKT